MLKRWTALLEKNSKLRRPYGRPWRTLSCTDANRTPARRYSCVSDVANRGGCLSSCAIQVRALALDPSVRLHFQGSDHSDVLQLNGKATISRDKLWEFVVKTWFTEGVDDPRITVIKVAPSEGYYWDNKHGNTVAGVKMLIGAALGKTLDDSIEGKLDVD